MLTHIDRMADALCQHDCISIDYKKSAHAAFDALMDAVPDLVWDESEDGGLSHYHSSNATPTYSISEIPKGNYVIALSDLEDNWYELARRLDEAEKVANTHHRAQVVAIWSDGVAV